MSLREPRYDKSPVASAELDLGQIRTKVGGGERTEEQAGLAVERE